MNLKIKNHFNILVSAMTRHFRDGQELPEICRDDFYSNNFQEIRLLHDRHVVLPGDALVTTCHYDTRQHNKATMFGFNITDEMCVSYVHFYQVDSNFPLSSCESAISESSLDNFFNHMIE